MIGAPYENDNEGAIYIYNGCKTGIFPMFSQRIPGAAVLPGIKSFGAALSKSYNMNDDNVNGEYFFNLFNSKGIFNTYELDESISKNSEYDQEIPQLQPADKPMAPRGRATQPSRDTRKTN